jgi:hypothetical protein
MKKPAVVRLIGSNVLVDFQVSAKHPAHVGRVVRVYPEVHPNGPLGDNKNVRSVAELQTLDGGTHKSIPMACIYPLGELAVKQAQRLTVARAREVAKAKGHLDRAKDAMAQTDILPTPPPATPEPPATVEVGGYFMDCDRLMGMIDKQLEAVCSARDFAGAIDERLGREFTDRLLERLTEYDGD